MVIFVTVELVFGDSHQTGFLNHLVTLRGSQNHHTGGDHHSCRDEDRLVPRNSGNDADRGSHRECDDPDAEALGNALDGGGLLG